jgi:transketolase
MGIAEQNMMLVSAGMASSGKIPFASTFAIFTERAFEQVRNGIARPGLVVHICGSHGGIHTGTDGSSAQSIEDLAIYRTIPNMTVMHPCDDLSAEELTLQLLNHDKPSYTRTARNKVPRVYNEDNVSNIKIGKGSIIEEGNDVAIIACGVMVNEAKIAAKKLSENGINACLVDMHTIKPLDGDLIQDLAKQCGCIVTVEDHSVIGGLGGGVAEYLSRNIPTPLEMVGVDDRFGESGGTSELMAHLNINYDSIINACHKVIKRK